MEMSTCESNQSKTPRRHSHALPSNAVHGVLVGGWNQEADGRHGRLAAFVVQHPPLVGLRVVQQGALVSSVDGDLEDKRT